MINGVNVHPRKMSYCNYFNDLFISTFIVSCLLLDVFIINQFYKMITDTKQARVQANRQSPWKLMNFTTVKSVSMQ